MVEARRVGDKREISKEIRHKIHKHKEEEKKKKKKKTGISKTGVQKIIEGFRENETPKSAKPGRPDKQYLKFSSLRGDIFYINKNNVSHMYCRVLANKQKWERPCFVL